MTRARDVANLIGSGNYSSTTFTATAGQTAFTISHTQGFIQVFMNGLLLDETVDYTSNGSAVTLTSGAAAGDEIEVVAYNTFSVGDALPKSGGAMTGDLTTTGNLGINETSPTAQLHIKNASTSNLNQFLIESTNAGTASGPDLTTYRNSSSPADGDTLGALWFYGNNSAAEQTLYAGMLGQVDDVTDGTEDASIYFFGQTGGTPETWVRINGNGISPSGETASVNFLDDYEEGTWTPDVRGNTSAGTIGYGTRSGQYTKIGNMVTVYCVIDVNSVTSASGRFYIYGLPFSAASSHEAVSIAQWNKIYTALPTNVEAVAAIIQAGNDYIHMRGMYTDTTSGPYYVPIQRFDYLRISLTYKTA